LLALHHWLLLAQQDWLDGHRLDELLESFGSVGGLCNADRGSLLAAGLTPDQSRQLKEPVDAHLRHAADWAKQDGNRVLAWTNPDYPTLLRQIPDPPPVLFVRGRAELLGRPQLAIVGSRRATAGGCTNAQRFARDLAAGGFVITSGLAAGIDTAAHRGALSIEAETIAVCGTGLDQVYPSRNRKLAEQIAVDGALVSEFPPGCGPRAFRFPRRNRVISGLATGTLVVEAGWRSGALITARLAATQGREVFALPGSINNPMARGCHRLIRQGVTLVETAGDIVAELGGLLGTLTPLIEQNAETPVGETAIAKEPSFSLLQEMGWDPVSVDELVARSGLTAAEVSSMLVALELAGRVEPLVGGRFLQREEGQRQ
jgi:DNA processing protein